MDNFLTPVVVLIVWTLIILVVMYSRLIPHLREANVDSQSTRSPEGKWRGELPEHVQIGMHNYNHLFEQPTIFYALMFYLHLSGGTEVWVSVLAWLYVGLRVIHSLIQITINQVLFRFTVFALSTLALMVMAVRGVALAF